MAAVHEVMNPSQPKDKPVEPTNQTPSSKASNPKEVRAERPKEGTQSAQTPDGGNGSKAPKR
jgi:hypothetical protein